MLAILRTLHQPQVESCVYYFLGTFILVSWMCKIQTSVSHSSTESEIISLDAGLRMDGIPALSLWDLVIEVFHSSTNKMDPRERAMEKPISSCQTSTPMSFQQTLVTFHQKQRILVKVFRVCL